VSPPARYVLLSRSILRNAVHVLEEGTLASATHTDVRYSADHEQCQVRALLDRVGDRWSVLIMAVLGDGPRRYSELRRAIDGISQRMLTLTLRGLRRDGLVIRSVTPTTPPQTHYALTPVGQALSVELRSLLRWFERHREYIVDSRRAFDGDRSA
jgi:DNA-binding HxlR family transcriptional regulator